MKRFFSGLPRFSLFYAALLYVLAFLFWFAHESHAAPGGVFVKDGSLSGITSKCMYLRTNYSNPTSQTLTANAGFLAEVTAGPGLTWTLLYGTTSTTYQKQTVTRIFDYVNEAGNWAIGSYSSPLTVISNTTFVSDPSVTVAYPTVDKDVCAPPPACAITQGQVNYKLEVTGEGVTPPTAVSCYENCQTQPEILWSDCMAGQCVHSVKYTGNGQACSGQNVVSALTPGAPDRCTAQLEAKIAECGGSMNVVSYDFTNCTGVCAPDPCHDKWLETVTRCGGIMAISSWDATTCSGTCANDPLPDPTNPDGTELPKEVETKTEVKPDGSKDVTQTSTYQEGDTWYQEATTTHYNAEGDVTGSSTSTTVTGNPASVGQPAESDGDEEGETFGPIGNGSGFNDPYSPGGSGTDLNGRVDQFFTNVKASPLFSFSDSFFSSVPTGGSSTYSIEAGMYGSHDVDLSESLSVGLPYLKAILLVCFGFLSIRCLIMKR